MEDNTTRGDWYAPVDQKPKKSNFVIITTVVIVVSLVVVGFWYYNSGGGAEEERVDTPQETPLVKTPEEIAAEKLLNAQRGEIDKLRAVYQAQKVTEPTATATSQTQVKTLDTLRTESVTQQTTTTTVTPKTTEEQMQELDALRAAARK